MIFPEKMRAFYFTLAFLAAITLSHALYFHIGETERKCFIEEVPDETLVVGEYTFFGIHLNNIWKSDRELQMPTF